MRHKRLLKKTFVMMCIFSFVFCGISSAGLFYRYNVDDLALKAKKRIEIIDKEMIKEEVVEELDSILTKVKDLYKEGEKLFKQGKYTEATEIYRRIDAISEEAEVKESLEKANKF